ncbi:MAG: hypothetical protein IV090_05505 [Candidatus Sericytochromatia bacterium]|nr:hypothetical protein [Candidatus Sericytochromatia bacterium]
MPTRFARLSQNIIALSVLFAEENEHLVLDFLNCFQVNGSRFVAVKSYKPHAGHCFIDFSCTDSEFITLNVEDEYRKEHLVEIHLLHILANIPYNEVRLAQSHYQNQKTNSLKRVKEYASISVIGIFNHSVQNEHRVLTQTRYLLGKPFEELRLNFIHLTNISDLHSQSTHLEKWAYLFHSAHKLSTIPNVFRKTVFSEVLKKIEIKKWSNRNRNDYLDHYEVRELSNIGFYHRLNLLRYGSYFDDWSIFEKEYTSARLNLKLLEHDLGIYPKVHIEHEQIDLTPLGTNIEEIANSLFQKWKSKASKKFPYFNFEIKDPQIIVSDVETDFKKAILSLITENENFLRGTYAYELYIGFVWGFIQGCLNFHWTHEYIAKKSDDYKKYAALKAIHEYLKIDKIKSQQLDKLYVSFLLKDSNNKYYDTLIDETDLREGALELEKTGEQGQLMTILNNLIGDFVVKVTQEEYDDFLDENVMYGDLIEETIKFNASLIDL